MFPNHLSEETFASKLHSLLSPARPVQSVEYLRGRTTELTRIKEALYAPGRHVFIYGDRGVGKSSLAAAAANQWQSSDAEYLDASCGPDSTLSSVVADIACKALNQSRIHEITRTTSAGIDLRYLRADSSQVIAQKDLQASVRSLTDAVDILREVAKIHSERPTVVIDEFDRMSDAKERNLFADLVKHLGDKKVGITFIFTAVGRTLDELLGANPSAIRQLETIELGKLGWEDRWTIASSALEAFGVTIDRDKCIRLAAVSDGYPFYVHLITEKLLWHIYNSDQVIVDITKDHYLHGIRDAIHSISAELKHPYEVAVNQDKEDFEEVLWACADSELLDRSVRETFPSYEYIMRHRPGRQVMDYDGFSSIVRHLKGKRCEGILIPSRFKKRGWYAFKENMLRGYVRLQAEAHGIELQGEQPSIPSPVMRVPASARRGHYGPEIPKGVFRGGRR